MFYRSSSTYFFRQSSCGCQNNQGCGCNQTDELDDTAAFVNGFQRGVAWANCQNQGCGCNQNQGCGCNQNQGCGCNRNQGALPTNFTAPASAGGSSGGCCAEAYYARQYGLHSNCGCNY